MPVFKVQKNFPEEWHHVIRLTYCRVPCISKQWLAKLHMLLFRHKQYIDYSKQSLLFGACHVERRYYTNKGGCICVTILEHCSGIIEICCNR